MKFNNGFRITIIGMFLLFAVSCTNVQYRVDNLTKVELAVQQASEQNTIQYNTVYITSESDDDNSNGFRLTLDTKGLPQWLKVNLLADVTSKNKPGDYTDSKHEATLIINADWKLYHDKSNLLGSSKHPVCSLIITSNSGVKKTTRIAIVPINKSL